MNKNNTNKLKEVYRGVINGLYLDLKLKTLPLELFDKYLPKKGDILDLGCGYGFISFYLNNHNKNFKILGIDPTKERIIKCKEIAQKKKIKNITFESKKIEELSSKKRYDLIIIIDIIHHIPRKYHCKFLSNVFKRLKIGGTLILRETDKDYSLNYFIFNWLSELFLYISDEKLNFYKKKEIEDMISGSGFKIINEFPSPKSIPWRHINIIARR